jgi:flagellar motor switch protein FliG
MKKTTPTLRKAAVLVRSLDAATAARLLGELAPEEAAALRAAVDSLGPLDPEEQADVVAELRCASQLAGPRAQGGVELTMSPRVADERSAAASPAAGKRFEFLEQAPINNLVQYLAREHAQTIAVVLANLAPLRAADLLAALPPRVQAEAIERLSALGETDADSLHVVEQELAAWVAARAPTNRDNSARDAVAMILSAADGATRDNILANLKTHKSHLAARWRAATTNQCAPVSRPLPPSELPVAAPSHRPAPSEPPRRIAPACRFDFHDLPRLDSTTLAGVVRDVDAGVLVLALAGASDELIERIGEQLPKRAAKALRRQLTCIGPTRLSDVEAAQRAVALAAARRLSGTFDYTRSECLNASTA